MADERNTTFPVAAFSVVVLLLSAIFVGDRPFDLPRLGETGNSKGDRLLQPPIEARLWEDPFAALKRYREKFKEPCATGPKADPVCWGEWPPIEDMTTIVAVLLPGEEFVGSEEMRRRTRYAVLAGLAQEGFVPTDSERMGFSRQLRCDWVGHCDGAPFDVPYEILRKGGVLPGRVLVLWIDDATLGRAWLSRVVSLLTDLHLGPSTDLRIIGPNDSTKFEKLHADFADLERRVDKISDDQRERFKDRWRTLARTQLINPFTTTAEDTLLEAVDPWIKLRYPLMVTLLQCKEQKCIDRFLDDRLKRIGSRLGLPIDLNGGEPVRFVRTIGTDQVNIDLLVKELCARGVAESSKNQVVLLHELDTVYARTLSTALERRLSKDPDPPCPESTVRPRVVLYSYLRGLDGVAVDGAPKEQRLIPRPAADKEKTDAKTPDIEWPETRDQRDYVRRLVDRMKLELGDLDTKFSTSTAAIGLLGSEVHDKLLLAQALRPAFPDRLLFTIDLDARLFHPEVLPFTRNLVVATSLPLVPPSLDDGRDIRVAPFRDVYQSATFYAARYAVAPHSLAQDRLAAIESELKSGALYEIGRDGPVRLGISKPPKREIDARLDYGILSLVVLLVLAGLILFGVPGPSMKNSRPSNPLTSVRCFRLTTAVLGSMTVAALGFGLGVVAELFLPGQVRLSGALALAFLAAILFVGFRYPGIGAPPGKWRQPRPAMIKALRGPRPRPALVNARQRRRVARIVALVVALGLVLALRDWSPPDAMPEPFTLTDGVSAWPSILLRTLVIVLFPWCLDFAWNKGVDIGRGIGREFFAYDPWYRPRRCRPPVNLTRLRWRFRRLCQYWAGSWPHLRRLRRVLAATSLWFWQPRIAWKIDKRVDGYKLWKAYRKLLSEPQRVGRLLCWLVLTFVAIFLFSILVAGPWPNPPVRGTEDRLLFRATTLGCGAAILVLLVLATNGAVLTRRLIAIMGKGRTAYPRAVVQRFAAELGPEITAQPLLYYPIAARIRDRGTSLFDGRNSLFDPWLDARFLAKHTESVSQLIYYPFALLALFIFSRSPLFDNWQIGGPVSILVTCYLLWAIAMGALLSRGAEAARRKIIEVLEKDLLWLQGAGARYHDLAAQYPRLIAQVRELRQGAFAPLTQQPLVHSMMVPLSVAGVQLVEMVVRAR